MTAEFVLGSLVALLLLAASAARFGYVLLIQPLLPAPVHGLRGLKRARARATDGFNDLEPPMRWLAARIAPLTSRARRAEIARRITIAGEVWGLAPEELEALSLYGAVAGVAVGSGYALISGGSPLFALALGVFGLMMPGLQLSSAGQSRVRTIQRRVPHLVDLLVLSLGAGLDFTASLRQVVERAADPESDMIEELGVILEELKLGRTRRAALSHFAERAPCDEVRDLVSATIQSEEQGTPLGSVLESQANTSRQRRSTQAEEAASKAGTAMILPMMLLFAALIILIVGPMMLSAMNSRL